MKLLPRNAITSINSSPKDGDVVIARVIGATGAYTSVEGVDGINISLLPGDVGVFVLGTRRSGVSVSAFIPGEVIKKGDYLDLIAQSGLLAKASCVPLYLSGHAMSVEVIGFLLVEGGSDIHNISNNPRINRSSKPNLPSKFVPVIFVVGTSAEVGKTTLMGSLARGLKGISYNRVAGIKACGTGRLKDITSYSNSGFDLAIDFVDAGLPSTYNISAGAYEEMLRSLICHAAANADTVCVEIGGDFIEGMAPQALEIMREMGGYCLVVVNDAMGAADALRRLSLLEVSPIAICSYRQNLETLAERINFDLSRVIDPKDVKSISAILNSLELNKHQSFLSPTGLTQGKNI